MVKPDGEECAVAQFDETAGCSMPLEAVGEIVTDTVPANFEGYWENEEADQARVRDGRYWSGDLAYKDAEGLLLLRRPG